MSVVIFIIDQKYLVSSCEVYANEGIKRSLNLVPVGFEPTYAGPKPAILGH